MVLNTNHRLIYMNQAAQALIGLNQAVAGGKTVEQILPDLISQIDFPADISDRSKEVVLGKRNPRTFDLRMSPISDARSNVVSQIIVLRDISDRKRAEEQLRYDASHDSLTNLYNRNYFLARLDDVIDHAQKEASYSWAVLFLDYDQFKLLNDSRGHAFGDKLLIESTQRLKQCLRPADTIARLGGDEFVILMEGIADVNQVISTANQLQEQLNLPFVIDGQDYFISTSIGIVFGNSNYHNPEDILQNGDIAMYHAKSFGRGYYTVFEPEMRRSVRARMDLETELRQVVDAEELQVFYQPIVSLSSRKVVGFEALVRWHHKERGLLYPSQFLSTALDTGLIEKIGKWVIKVACTQMAFWVDQIDIDSAMTMSINLTPNQLAHPDLLQDIDLALDSSGLLPSRLKLEITESVIMADISAAVATLGKLSARGIHLAIDDFGTGYSSLNYLAKLPIDTMKIDRSFIHQINTNQDYLRIVQSIMNLAASLNKDVVAEGVENEAQIVTLTEMGVDHAQGFYFYEALNNLSAQDLLLEQFDGKPH